MNPKPRVVTPAPDVSFFLMRRDYWRLAHWALNEGLITRDEAYRIARIGTRKEIYWARHLQDLIEIVDSREAKNEVPN